MVYLKDNKMISRKGMGCPMDIGDLYDAVNDRCLESSVFKNKDELMKKYLKENSFNQRQLRYASVDNYSDLFNALDVNSEQQASILAGLMTPVGACSILNEDFDSEKVLLKYSVRDKITKLDVTEPEVSKLITENEIQKAATHLVVGIIHGYDIVVSFEPRWSDNKAEKFNLLSVFEHFEEALKEGNARAYLNTDMKHVSTVATKVFSDIDNKDLPAFDTNSNHMNSLKSTLLLLCQLEATVLSVPLVYLMLPISTVFEKSGKCFQLVKDRFYLKSNSGKIRESLGILNNADSTKKTFEKFENLVDTLGHNVFSDATFNEIGAYRKDMKTSLTKQKLRFRKWLISARTKLNTQNFQLLDSEYTPTKTGQFLEKYSAERKKLEWIRELRGKGVSFCQSRNQLVQELDCYEEVYLFKYDSAMFETTEWKDAYWKFLELLPGKNKFQVVQQSWNDPLGAQRASSTSSTIDLLAGRTSYVIFENKDHLQSGVGNLFEENAHEELVCAIEYYLDGLVVNPKVLDLFMPNTCKWDRGYPSESERFNYPSSAVVTTACPGFHMGRCNEKDNIKWTCEGCGQCLQFDFEGNFFCECGRGPIDRCTFKCNSLVAGNQYIKPEKQQLLARLKRTLKPREEINLLVMGETGVGKTTFINAFANYLTYSTLEEAEASELIALIPASFTITGADFQTRRVTIGNDDSEIRDVGASQTQFCKCYTFPSDNQVVRIIDTPGIGDTRGVTYDEANFENILSFISNYPSIQGILLLLKPNNARLSIFFRFCVQQLLCHLHKSASNNIVFVYTNARGTFYRPGDTHPPLKELLLGIERREPYVKIILEKPTIYCLDNEAFRFLVALKNDIKFNKDHRDNFSDSWIQSVTECHRLFEYVQHLTPHKVTETISLNQVRKLILTLAKPLGDISQNIQLNISQLEDQQEKIHHATNDISNLRRVLLVPIVDLEPVAFEHPRTVCTAPECVKVYNVGGIQKVDYVQICHPRCYLTDVQPDVINNSALMYCAAMGDSRTNCVVCKNKCPYEKHMHIYYENKHINVNKVDKSIEKEINNKEKRVVAVNRTIANLRSRVEDLNNEQKEIMKLSAKFGQFLRRSAITPYNDALKDYMDYLISVEEQKRAADPSKKALVKELKKMKVEYENEIRIIQCATVDESNAQGVIDQITLEDIRNAVHRLYRLPINGPVIQRMVDIMNRGRQGEHANVGEKIYRPRMSNRPKFAGAKKVGAVKKIFNKFQRVIGF